MPIYNRLSLEQTIIYCSIYKRENFQSSISIKMATISFTEMFDFKLRRYKVLIQLVKNKFVSFFDKFSSNISPLPNTNNKDLSVSISGNASSEAHKISHDFIRSFCRILPERSQVVASDRQDNIIVLTRCYADLGTKFI